MKTTLKLEELALFGLSIYLFTRLDFAWWYFPAFILLPDIGMIGYAFGARIGALTYNLFHHKGLAVIVLLLGYWIGNDWVALIGIILFGHASMDRIFGYGLKYPDHFKNTHLGVIGE
ncbi:DUF4260 domain-containing protein [Marinoscillum sp.]|uniref:DUF4260 domain-containing protein n=1 Tax=Marinoscillum sp. TaxID=2024838 RepID=UPI003BAC6E3A